MALNADLLVALVNQGAGAYMPCANHAGNCGLEYWCETCKEAVCHKGKDRHKSDNPTHRIHPIEDAASSGRDAVTGRLVELKSSIESVSAILSKVDKQLRGLERQTAAEEQRLDAEAKRMIEVTIIEIASISLWGFRVLLSELTRCSDSGDRDPKHQTETGAAGLPGHGGAISVEGAGGAEEADQRHAVLLRQGDGAGVREPTEGPRRRGGLQDDGAAQDDGGLRQRSERGQGARQAIPGGACASAGGLCEVRSDGEDGLVYRVEHRELGQRWSVSSARMCCDLLVTGAYSFTCVFVLLLFQGLIPCSFRSYRPISRKTHPQRMLLSAVTWINFSI